MCDFSHSSSCWSSGVVMTGGSKRIRVPLGIRLIAIRPFIFPGTSSKAYIELFSYIACSNSCFDVLIEVQE
jgi:hypothetical protein